MYVPTLRVWQLKTAASMNEYGNSEDLKNTEAIVSAVNHIHIQMLIFWINFLYNMKPDRQWNHIIVYIRMYLNNFLENNNQRKAIRVVWTFNSVFNWKNILTKLPGLNIYFNQ